METPYSENLLLSAGYGLNGLFGDSQPVPPARRNQIEVGIQRGSPCSGRRSDEAETQVHARTHRSTSSAQRATATLAISATLVDERCTLCRYERVPETPRNCAAASAPPRPEDECSRRSASTSLRHASTDTCVPTDPFSLDRQRP